MVKDVNEGREALNISTASGEIEGGEMAERIQSGEMPPGNYKILHPEANLTEAQKSQLIDGVQATFGGEGEG